MKKFDREQISKKFILEEVNGPAEPGGVADGVVVDLLSPLSLYHLFYSARGLCFGQTKYYNTIEF